MMQIKLPNQILHPILCHFCDLLGCKTELVLNLGQSAALKSMVCTAKVHGQLMSLIQELERPIWEVVSR